MIEYNDRRAGKGLFRKRGKSMLAIVLLLLAAYAVWPRQADLYALDPAGMARRETVGPAASGRTIAEVAEITYGKSLGDPAMVASGIARAEAMADRDARHGDDGA